MQIAQFLTPDCTVAGVPGVSKKRLFETISDFASKIHPETDAEDIFDALIARERLGSTGIGDGVAIPHCRLDSCEKITGILFSLNEPIDFDAIDGNPVDLVFTLLVPQETAEDHLLALQAIAEYFNQSENRALLRQIHTDDTLYHAVTSG